MQPSWELFTCAPGGRCRPEYDAYEQRQYRDTTKADATAQSDANAIGPTHRNPRPSRVNDSRAQYLTRAGFDPIPAARPPARCGRSRHAEWRRGVDTASRPLSHLA